MNASETIAAALSEGRLGDAIGLVQARLRNAPTDRDARLTLVELLCLSGALERADAQAEILSKQDDTLPVRLARMRHLIRAASARDAWHERGAVPALLAEPTPVQRAALALSVAMRGDDPAAIATVLAEAEAARPILRGTVDGVPFEDLRDADDRSAWMLEVLTFDGGYLWVDWARVAELRFEGPPRRPIDLLWREARLSLHDGTVADLVVPAQYVAPDADDAMRLARETGWRDGPGGVVRGAGQRVWLIGDDARDLLSLELLSFAEPAR